MSSLRRRATRLRRRAMGRIALGFVAAGIAWIAGLFWFAAQIPVPAGPPPSTETTDAIVVLTGGSGRLDTGLQLMAEERAAKLFVSGVARGVEIDQLLLIARRQPEDFACCIAVGYDADNTAGNAAETAEWMREQGYASLRLVTANYHMPRSLVEFRSAMPGIRIVPHPVYPPQFMIEAWWRWPGTAMLLASEYSKYLLARLRPGTSWRGAGAGAA